MYCEHVYKDVGCDVCPICKGVTHETDWDFQNKLLNWWPNSGNAKLVGWWSI
jgi:hypothetical protein